MRSISNPAVAKVVDGYPPLIRQKLLALRELIFATAATTQDVGPLEETLKWGEPAYLTTHSKSGSTIRIAWKASQPEHYAMYFHCQTNLISTFRTLFPDDFHFEGNRGIVFHQDTQLPTEYLALCIATALTYHIKKQK